MGTLGRSAIGRRTEVLDRELRASRIRGLSAFKVDGFFVFELLCASAPRSMGLGFRGSASRGLGV